MVVDSGLKKLIVGGVLSGLLGAAYSLHQGFGYLSVFVSYLLCGNIGLLTAGLLNVLRHKHYPIDDRDYRGDTHF